eukprot:TRINITY_DN746_c0_g1_i6.p1 TRINITY_DN746_c0_g1~~TRINITY_DN746_c0_g1_i6.p1  ORF type:complete len:433 (+),score=-4.37 TRINITY_DN746_c0_g1_i6:118-1299(+)
MEINPHLDQRALDQLKAYEYSTSGGTYLDKSLRPFYKLIAQHIPHSISPNMITFTGFITILTALSVVLMQDIGLNGNVAQSNYYMLGAALLAYQTLDALDGIHSRNLGTPSPLGKLFDSGLDSFLHPLIIVAQVQALGLGNTEIALWYFYGITIAFFTSEWQLYYTGIENTGVGFIGLTEGQMLFLVTFYLTGMYGQGFWDSWIRPVIWLPILIAEVGLSVYSMKQVFTIDHPEAKWKRGLDLVPFVQFVGLSFVWTRTAFYEKCPLLVFLSMSVLFYLLNWKMLVSCVTKTKLKLFHIELVYLLIPTFLLIAEKAEFMRQEVGEKVQVYAGILVMLLILERGVTYSYLLISQVTSHLGYRTFEVPHQNCNEVLLSRYHCYKDYQIVLCHQCL